MVLLHGFIKKTQKTPDEDLDLARATRESIKGDCNECKKKSEENGPQWVNLR